MQIEVSCCGERSNVNIGTVNISCKKLCSRWETVGAAIAAADKSVCVMNMQVCIKLSNIGVAREANLTEGCETDGPAVAVVALPRESLDAANVEKHSSACLTSTSRIA